MNISRKKTKLNIDSIRNCSCVLILTKNGNIGDVVISNNDLWSQSKNRLSLANTVSNNTFQLFEQVSKSTVVRQWSRTLLTSNPQGPEILVGTSGISLSLFFVTWKCLLQLWATAQKISNGGFKIHLVEVIPLKQSLIASKLIYYAHFNFMDLYADSVTNLLKTQQIKFKYLLTISNSSFLMLCIWFCMFL